VKTVSGKVVRHLLA